MSIRKAKFSFSGIALGALALMVALIHFWAGPFSAQPTLEETVAESAIAIRDTTLAALRGEESSSIQESPPLNLDRALQIAVPLLGGLAIILGVIGFAFHEPLRVAGGAAFLGASGIAFQFATFALAAIILAILVAAVISQLGFG